VVASRSKPPAHDIEEDLMTDRKEFNERGERDGEYTDTEEDDVNVPEPESGEYTDSEIPGDEPRLD
jgi:hypothetical protein